MSVIVDLKEQTILTAHINIFYFLFLEHWVWVIISIFEVENCKDGVPSMMVQNDWSTWQMLVVDSPKSNILSAARDQLVRLYGRKLQSQDVKVTNLPSQHGCSFFGFCLRNV